METTLWETLAWSLAIATLIFGLVPFGMLARFFRYVKPRMALPSRSASPKTTVIMPCKGLDLEFQENIRSLLNQDYPNYEVLFVTATSDDPAYAALNHIRDAGGNRALCKVLVAGIEPGRGQKLTNMLKGMSSLPADTEVVAFLDADVRLHKSFLRALVAPLADPQVGVSCGYHVFVPRSPRIGSLLRFIWGIGGLLTLADQERNFAIGAAAALRKETFDRARIRESFLGSVSDTFSITNSVRRIGLRVHFAPRCLFISPDNSSLMETIRWSNRLTILSRVYNRPFWWMVTLSYSFQVLMMLTGALLLGLSLSFEGVNLGAPAALMLSPLLFQFLMAVVVLSALPGLLPDYPADREGLLRHSVRICALTPVAPFMIFLNTVVSLFSREIVWRGIRYRLISATRTEVLPDKRVLEPMLAPWVDILAGTLSLSLLGSGVLGGTLLILNQVPVPAPLAGLFSVVVPLTLTALLSGLYARILHRIAPVRPGEYSLARPSLALSLWKHHGLLSLFNISLLVETGFISAPIRGFFYRFLGVKGARKALIGGKILEPGLVRMGTQCVVGSGALITGHQVESQRLVLGPIVIGDRVTIGVNSVVFPNTVIGDDAIIAAGAVVPAGTRIGESEIWGGIPARRIGSRNQRVKETFSRGKERQSRPFTEKGLS
ncbi:MAG: glycosyltransferase [Oligoflexia bacterium]|nr:glycosyltransferase [Oligoflexia bacterium]